MSHERYSTKVKLIFCFTLSQTSCLSAENSQLPIIMCTLHWSSEKQYAFKILALILNAWLEFITLGYMEGETDDIRPSANPRGCCFDPLSLDHAPSPCNNVVKIVISWSWLEQEPYVSCKRLFMMLNRFWNLVDEVLSGWVVDGWFVSLNVERS